MQYATGNLEIICMVFLPSAEGFGWRQQLISDEAFGNPDSLDKMDEDARHLSLARVVTL